MDGRGTFMAGGASNEGELVPARIAQHAPAEDAALVRNILLGDEAAFETVMRRYNGRLFRVALPRTTES